MPQQRCNQYWTLYEKLCAQDSLTSEQLKQKMQQHLNSCPQCGAWWREVKHKYHLVPATRLTPKGATA